MAVLPHEGSYSVMYGALAVPIGSSYRAGYLARPDRAGRFPTVILVADLDGPTSHEKGLARRLARAGIALLVVDVFDRTVSSGDALADYHRFDDAEAMRVLDEASDFLASEDIDWAHADRLGLLGLDVAGRFALAQAAHRPGIASVAVVETPLTGDEERRFPVADMLAHLAVPTLGLYGADDELIAPETVDEAQRRNTTGTWLLYAGAGHGFLDATAPGYEQASAEDAIARLASFFLANLPAAAEIRLG
jgi:carboxymethylenebutenolidase